MAANSPDILTSVDPEAFAARLDALGPFEATPRVAVAVSGGADSMALVLLADHWAKARGGAVVALTVDHGLRPEAASEARQVGEWMAARAIPHHILRHDGPTPTGDIQAAARDIRYGLLLADCRARGVLHLLLAHHLDDQAETVLLRLARGSGVSGLSGMAEVSYRAEARLLRPLLEVPGGALRAFLRDRGQGWIEDPSNRDTAFARVRMRAAASVLEPEGVSAPRLGETAYRLARARDAIDQAAADVLAKAAVIDPRGWAWLDPEAVLAAPDEVALRLLADLLSTVGGRRHGPRADRLERLLGRLGTAATLHGCRLTPEDDGHLLVREARGLEVRHGLRGGDEVFWDGRFRMRLTVGPGEVSVGPLRTAGWAEAARACPEAARGIPVAARASLPAIYDMSGLLSVPHLGYNREVEGMDPVLLGVSTPAFRPRRSAGALGFRLARRRTRIM